MSGVASTSRETVFNVLNALGFVGIWEPVLAHEEVVAESDGTTSHEDLGYRERRHGGRRIGFVQHAMGEVG